MSDSGTLIDGKYTIIAKLREGGMGAIYKVRHNFLDEIRVIKVMKPQVAGNPELEHRFLQEAKLVTRLKHDNIASIFDYALGADSTAYIVMEFIDGVSLADMLKVRGRVDVGLGLEIARQSLDALAYLHRKSVVHRDISPDNIMLTADEDGRLLVKLIDLGIAKATDETHSLTQTGMFLGKVRYASPEQLGTLPKGESLDGRSDLYSFGVVLYQLLTGSAPIPGDTAQSMVAGHLFHPPTPFSESDAEGRVPEPVRAIILKSLEKKREDRYGSAEEFEEAIAAIQGEYPAGMEALDARALIDTIRPQQPTQPGSSITPGAQQLVNQEFRASSETPLPSGTTQPDGTIPSGDVPT
ncbi:MAG: serine/threonine-protein kinase, partial [Thermoanaerobaculia bacterium]